MLRIQHMDLLEAYQAAEVRNAKEREGLIDKIMSLSNPAALREFRGEVRKITPQVIPTKLHWPGMEQSLRPPVPWTTPPREQEEEMNGDQESAG